MAKYEGLQGMYDELHKRCDELEKKKKELLAYKRSAACKLAMHGPRAMREGAGIKDTDTPTWDLGNAGHEARRSAFERARAGLMSACFTVHKGGSCTASPT